MYKAKHTEGRYINQVLPGNHPVFGMNLFAGVEANWQVKMTPSAFIPELEIEASSGWKMNLKEVERNFPYSKLDISATFRCSDRFSIETGAEAKLLYSNEYDFYQAAGITLRGFRDNRFIGKQSFYQHTDFRLDMGKSRIRSRHSNMGCLPVSTTDVSGSPANIPISGIPLTAEASG